MQRITIDYLYPIKRVFLIRIGRLTHNIYLVEMGQVYILRIASTESNNVYFAQKQLMRMCIWGGGGLHCRTTEAIIICHAI